jgi:hypothetical protein
MKTFIKQLFCSHIWKEEKKEFLGIKRLSFGLTPEGFTTYANYEFYAISKRCVKCNKTHIDEKRYLII